MSRWQPDTQQRLVQAALELYTEQGYDRTTVSEIASRVGVTSRTYFRYFPDKREVLFASGKTICDAITAATSEALTSLPPYEAVLAGVIAGEAVFQSREFARVREAVIVTTQELRERELSKLSMIASALTDQLLQAGVAEPVARMTADVGVTIFVEATRRWQADEDADFKVLVHEAAQLLRETTSALTPPR